MSEPELIDRGKVIAERLRVLGSDTVPSSGDGSAEPGTVLVPGSGNQTGTTDAIADRTVPSSQPLLREPGTDTEKSHLRRHFRSARRHPAGTAKPVSERTDGHRLSMQGKSTGCSATPTRQDMAVPACLVEALKRGRTGLIIDLDHNGPEATVSRLLDLGAPESALRDPDSSATANPRTEPKFDRSSKTPNYGAPPSQ